MPRASPGRAEELKGRISKVFQSSAWFSAGILVTSDSQHQRFVGKFFANEGDQVVLRGRWTNHRKYGRQFNATTVKYDLDMSADGLVRYLANHPEIKGIGPARARLIVEYCGEDFDRLIRNEPGRIAEAAKVPLDAILNLREKWIESALFNKVCTLLSAFGLSHNQVATLVKKLGDSAYSAFKADPYRLIREVRELGFYRVDEVALKMGFPKQAKQRIRAGLYHCVQTASRSGHCWVEYDELLHSANRLLVMDDLDSMERIDRELDRMIDLGDLVCYPEDRFLVALPHLLAMEKFLCHVFSKGLGPNPNFPLPPDDSMFNSKRAMELYPGQRRALMAAMVKSVCVITGSAGSGKSYLISAINDVCELEELSVALAAPTGKAAKRMAELAGCPAKTIHRLLGFRRGEFSFNAVNPLEHDVVIIDEFSMVDVALAFHLFQAIDLRRTSVVLVGDHNQLPPVGPGNALRDLIRDPKYPVIPLDQVVRQAGVLKKSCTAVLDGVIAPTAKADSSGRQPWVVLNKTKTEQDVIRVVENAYRRILKRELGYDPVQDVQLLTPTNKGALGTVELNARLQRIVQKELWNVEVPVVKPRGFPKFLKHDKVIQTRNNYEVDVMNGEIGFVKQVFDNGSALVSFDGREPIRVEPGSAHMKTLQLAYALTIHKSQGSEYPCVLLIVHRSHSFQHHRNLLYTGVTRAKETAVIIGDGDAVYRCAAERRADQRATFMPFLLGPRPSLWELGRTRDITRSEEQSCLT